MSDYEKLSPPEKSMVNVRTTIGAIRPKTLLSGYSKGGIPTAVARWVLRKIHDRKFKKKYPNAPQTKEEFIQFLQDKAKSESDLAKKSRWLYLIPAATTIASAITGAKSERQKEIKFLTEDNKKRAETNKLRELGVIPYGRDLPEKLASDFGANVSDLVATKSGSLKDYVLYKLAQIGASYSPPVFGSSDQEEAMASDPMQQTLSSMSDYAKRNALRVRRFKAMTKRQNAMRAAQPLNPFAQNVLSPAPMVQQVEQPSGGETNYDTGTPKVASMHKIADADRRREITKKYGNPTTGEDRQRKKRVFKSLAGTLTKFERSSRTLGVIKPSKDLIKQHRSSFWGQLHPSQRSYEQEMTRDYRSKKAIEDQKFKRTLGALGLGVLGLNTAMSIRDMIRDRKAKKSRGMKKTAVDFEAQAKDILAKSKADREAKELKDTASFLKQRSQRRSKITQKYGPASTSPAERAAKKAKFKGFAEELKKRTGTADLPNWLGASDESYKRFKQSFWKAKSQPGREKAQKALSLAEKGMNKSKWAQRAKALGVGVGLLGAAKMLRRAAREDMSDYEPKESPRQNQQPVVINIQGGQGAQGGQSGISDEERQANNREWLRRQFNPSQFHGQIPIIKTGAKQTRGKRILSNAGAGAFVGYAASEGVNKLLKKVNKIRKKANRPPITRLPSSLVALLGAGVGAAHGATKGHTKEARALYPKISKSLGGLKSNISKPSLFRPTGRMSGQPKTLYVRK